MTYSSISLPCPWIQQCHQSKHVMMRAQIAQMTCLRNLFKSASQICWQLFGLFMCWLLCLLIQTKVIPSFSHWKERVELHQISCTSSQSLICAKYIIFNAHICTTICIVEKWPAEPKDSLFAVKCLHARIKSILSTEGCLETFWHNVLAHPMRPSIYQACNYPILTRWTLGRNASLVVCSKFAPLLQACHWTHFTLLSGISFVSHCLVPSYLVCTSTWTGLDKRWEAQYGEHLPFQITHFISKE